MRTIVAFLIACFIAKPCLAWSEGGHHLIAVMAFDRLTETQQLEIIEALRAHPRFTEDFKVPEEVDDENHWLIGRAAYWPDVARKTPYDRPDWHWQLGATLVIGNPPNVPKNPGPCPDDATLDTKDLHIEQAIELCRRIWKDKTKPPADQAIALCWLGHLVGDAHQPCHAGSLYTEKLFPDGDRRANNIPTKQGRNMQNLWDGLLGPKFDEADIRRRAIDIRHDEEAHKFERMLEQTWDPLEANDLDPMVWLAKSAHYGRSHVYTAEVLVPIKKADQNGEKLEQLDLSDEFLKEAGRISRLRCLLATKRLAGILAEGLGK